MENSLRIFIFFSITVYFAILAVMLRKKALSLRYTLLWIICGMFFLFFAVFPSVVFRVSAWVGISNPVNAIFFLLSVFSIVMLLSISSIVSKQNERILRLTQTMALLEERLHELEQDKKV